MVFLILCLPRSRSAWLAHYLSYPLARPPQLIGHETLINCENVNQFIGSYQHGMWGTVETAGAMLWRIVKKELPSCKIILIRRPLIEVQRSLANVGVVGDLHALAEMDAMLDAAQTDSSIVSIPYNLLSEPWLGKWLFETCLDLEFDFEWWSHMIQMNVQVDMPEWMKKIQENRHMFEAFKADVMSRGSGYLGKLNGHTSA